MWDPVRLFGVGQWGRSDEGIWELEKMQVQSLKGPSNESLSMTMARLRAAECQLAERRRRTPSE